MDELQDEYGISSEKREGMTYEKQRFYALVEELLEEGCEPDRVFRDMVFAALTSAHSHSDWEHQKLLRRTLNDWGAYLNMLVQSGRIIDGPDDDRICD